MSQNQHNPCRPCCDWTDADEVDQTDAGCCHPAQFRRTCEAPVLPVQECPDEETEMVFDDETEEFTLVGELLDFDCSTVLDQNGAEILVAIG